MRRAAMVSFRLGGVDGVSVDAAAWTWALEQLGWEVRSVAGAGPADVLVPGLGIDPDGGPPPPPPPVAELSAALDGCEVVVVENLLSLPLNPGAAAAVAEALRGRRALLRHHDLPWQRAWSEALPPPPDDPAWTHVASMAWSRDELAERGIDAAIVGCVVDTEAPPGDRDRARAALGVEPGERLVLQPSRAIARKDVPAGLAVAEAIGATYWLTGPAEEGYQPTLDGLLAGARTRVLRRLPPDLTMADAYAACDAVAFPSRYEGFGIPVLEAAVARRPVVVGPNAAARELVDLGLQVFTPSDTAALAAFVEHPDRAWLDHNAVFVARHFALRDLPRRLAALLP